MDKYEEWAVSILPMVKEKMKWVSIKNKVNIPYTTDKNVDYIPVTVVALDRRGNAIAVGKDSITDFYSGATRSFGVSYILTREQRSNIVQCVVYAREAVSK